MTVYVESNFIVELALLQEQHESCAKLLELSSEGHIQLVTPAFSLAEPFETLIRASKKRQLVADELRTELRQLGRSAPYEDQTVALEGLTALLVSSQEEERLRLHATLRQILLAGEVIPLTADILEVSLRHQEDRGFSPQDAIVYASVLDHLGRAVDGENVFLNRNSKDFDDPDVQDELEHRSCRTLFSFGDGLGYVRHKLGLQPGA